MTTNRIPLPEWQDAHPSDANLIYADAGRDQIRWVRTTYSYAVWNCLLRDKSALSVDERFATLTVEGQHRSKSVMLPVYHFDVEGVTIKIRGNFYNWCLRCSHPIVKAHPSYLCIDELGGCFEGMNTPEDEALATRFCVPSQEYLFAATLWLLSEGIKR